MPGLLKLFLSAETQDIVLQTNLCSHWGQTGNSGQSFPLLSGRRYTCSLLQSSRKRVMLGASGTLDSELQVKDGQDKCTPSATPPTKWEVPMKAPGPCVL